MSPGLPGEVLPPRPSEPDWMWKRGVEHSSGSKGDPGGDPGPSKAVARGKTPPGHRHTGGRPGRTRQRLAQEEPPAAWARTSSLQDGDTTSSLQDGDTARPRACHGPHGPATRACAGRQLQRHLSPLGYSLSLRGDKVHLSPMLPAHEAQHRCTQEAVSQLSLPKPSPGLSPQGTCVGDHRPWPRLFAAWPTAASSAGGSQCQGPPQKPLGNVSQFEKIFFPQGKCESPARSQGGFSLAVWQAREHCAMGRRKPLGPSPCWSKLTQSQGGTSQASWPRGSGHLGGPPRLAPGACSTRKLRLGQRWGCGRQWGLWHRRAGAGAGASPRPTHTYSRVLP